MIRGGEPWKNTQILFTLGLVFLCGAIAGALVYRASSQSVKAVSWNDNNKEVTLNRLQKELQLTPDQTAEIETVLDDFTMYYQMLQAQMDEVRATGKSRMEQLLNEEQRKKFGRIMHDFRDKQIR
jgi:LPS O-antigen subunit length determinant protein (WzzB/FepE family)